MDFKTLPKGPVTLTNLSLPHALSPSAPDAASAGFVPARLTVHDGTICSDHPHAQVINMDGAIALPCFTDMHTHLDKGHIWPRKANPDGTFMGAINAVAQDRATHWTAEDVRKRMDFALRCAWAHGTSAIRTHLDSSPPQDAISFPVYREIREDWADRIDLQACSLVGLAQIEPDSSFARTADLVAQSGGLLGCATTPMPEAKARLQTLFQMADARGLAVDLHVDETDDPQADILRMVAETVLEMGFELPVTVGHCCSLATQPESQALDTLDLVARAGLNVVSLPMCNMYLQDRMPGRTPRWRGVTLVHEMAARGISVSFASDNTRDPFYAYGDLDMIEVMREATRIAHLDHSALPWCLAFNANPARACGFAPPSFTPGSPADMVICNARSWSELFARPQMDRIVLRQGQQIDRTLPGYAELDCFNAQQSI